MHQTGQRFLLAYAERIFPLDFENSRYGNPEAAFELVIRIDKGFSEVARQDALLASKRRNTWLTKALRAAGVLPPKG